MIVGVDLASKASACVVLDDAGEVIDQFDSWGKSAIAFIDPIVNWMTYTAQPVSLVVEDVPYGISNQKMIKSVLRLQGLLYGLLVCELEPERLQHVHYVLPSTWQRHFTVWRGGKDAAKVRAEELGYTAPNLLELYADRIPEKGPLRTKARADLRKSETDYADAYLISKWALEVGDRITSLSQVFYI